MFARILHHECLIVMRDRSLAPLALLFALCTAYGLYNGISWVDARETTLRAAALEEFQRLSSLSELLRDPERLDSVDRFRDPRSPGAVGRNLGQRYAALPPTALAPLSIGQSDLYPGYFKVSVRSKDAFVNNDELENPINLLAGRFDLAFVIVFLVPLFVIALSYNLLSQEREQGTLAMVLSQPVSFRLLLAGKVAVRAGLLVGIIIAVPLLGLLASGVDLSDSRTLSLFLLWSAAVIVYGLFWFFLAVTVNAFGSASSTNAVTLSAMWLLLVLILPSALNIAITTAYPVPSRVELINELRAASNSATSRGSQLLAKYYEDHPELVSNSSADLADFTSRLMAVQQDVDRRMMPVMQRYDEQLVRQQRAVQRFRFLSPAIIMQEALNDIAGTGLERYRHFLRLVDGYHKQWQAYFLPRIFEQAQMTTEDYEQLPRFVYKEESLDPILLRTMLGLIGLALSGALLLWIGLSRLRYYPIQR
ncbi:MAG: ABC transporter permease [Bryobacteraceae bacterium]